MLASGIARINPVAALVALLDRWERGEFELCYSTPILRELERTLQRPYFRARVSSAELAEALHNLEAHVTRVTIDIAVVGVATHPEDDLILATAVSAGADYLVTGDQQLLALGSYEAVRIVAPRPFLAILAAQS